MLRRLILVHGRTKYLSISEFVLYFFYKNCVVSMPQFFFSYSCGFSGMTVFDDFYLNLFNVVFTNAPPFAMGVLYWDIMPEIDEGNLLPNDQKDAKRATLNHLLAKLYSVGQLRKAFNTKMFLLMEA